MAGDENDDIDPFTQYGTIFGVPSRRRIMALLAWIICITTLIVISFAILSKQDTSKNTKEVFAAFKTSLNVSVNPCTNFYNFTCGLWAENNPMPVYSTRFTAFSKLQDAVNKKNRDIFDNTKVDDELPRVVKDAVRFYNVCRRQNSTNKDDIQLLLEYFHQIGGWPILNKFNWSKSSFDWIQSSAFLIKNMDLHIVIGVYTIDNDEKDGRNVIYLKPPNLLQDEDGTLDNAASTRMLYVILNSLNDSNVHSDVLDDIEHLKEVEAKWYELLSVSDRVSTQLYMSVEELMKKIPQVDWLNYFQLITNETLYEINETITINDTVVIDNFDFLKKVINLLNSDTFSKSELANLFGWFIVKDIWILIPGVFQYYADLNDYSAEDRMIAANDKCYDLVLELFPCSVDFLYVKNSSVLQIQDSQVLTKYLKSAFQDIVKNSYWLDEITKNLILIKLKNMRNVIGFSNYLHNATKFDKTYENFPVLDEVDLRYFFKIAQFYVKMRILYLKVPISHRDWILPRPVSDVSAYYIVNQNVLVYPISLHNPPFYYFKGPWFLNFGAVGSVIGHEMMHGFDMFGNEGNELEVAWLKNSSKTLYQERSQCFKHQYDTYNELGICENNGTRTLRENIADSEGLHIAFEAYKKYVQDAGNKQSYHLLNDYTPDQMFFIAYGTVWCSNISPLRRRTMVTGSHSLPEVRVNKAVSNSKSFASAFNCPNDSPMNPVTKCLIW